MTVEVWTGAKPTNVGEQQALIELFEFLKSQAEHYVVLCNFHAGNSSEIDLLVLKSNAVFVAEIKHFRTRIIGAREGEWVFVKNDGARQTFRNPFKQVRACAFGWKDWCRDHQTQIEQISGRRRDLKVFDPLEYIIVYPELHPKSEVDIGQHPVQAVGMEMFKTALVVRSSPGVDLTPAEMQTLPRLLKLTRWDIEPPKFRRGDQTRRFDQAYQPPVVRMLVARGHSLSNLIVPLDKDVVTIGREDNNDLMIDDDFVSRHHAEIKRIADQWVVCDLKSTNGTFVSFKGDPRQERQIKEQNALKNGSIVRFGRASYTVLLDEDVK